MTKRIEWLDCLKGFLIFLVVYGHSTPRLGGMDSAISCLIGSFHMPAFFFVSGYCVRSSINGRDLISRFLALVIPTLVVGSICTIFRGDPVTVFLFDMDSWFGYWFCITLFDVYLVYALIALLLNKLSLSDKQRSIFFALLIPILFIGLQCVYKFCPQILSGFLSTKWIRISVLIHYLDMFLLGVLIRLQRNNFDKFICNNVVISFVFVLFVTLFIFNYLHLGSSLPSFINSCLDLIEKFCAIFVLFHIFSNVFLSDIYIYKIKKILIYVGQRTLAIYLLHWFFFEGLLNVKFTAIGSLINQNWFLELIIISTISIAICGACLAVEKVLQKFPLLHSLAFGIKLKKKA